MNNYNYSSLIVKDERNNNILSELFDTNNLKLLVKDGHTITYEQYRSIVKRPLTFPIFKLYILNYDETIREDISEYLLTGGSFDINYNSGQRRTLSVKLRNDKNKFEFNPYGGLWKGVKFRFDMGIHTDYGDYIKQCGIFVPSDPDIMVTGSNRYVTLNLVDKFATLDGTVGGRLTNVYTIPRGSNIYEVGKSLLKIERMESYPYDTKQVIMPRACKDITTPYTITKSAGDSVGSIFLDLGTIANCQVYYNEYGNLIFESNEDELQYSSKSPIWHFTEDELSYTNMSLKINFSQVENVVTVTGANINGDLMSCTLENVNPYSPTNIRLTEPNPVTVEDENIASDKLAYQRCEYELFKRSLLPISASFTSIFLPHLDVSKVVTITNQSLKYDRERFLINSINYPISINCTPNINLSNVSEVAFSV